MDHWVSISDMQEQVSISNTRTYQLCPRGWIRWGKPHWFHSPLCDQMDPLRQTCLGQTAWLGTAAWIRGSNRSPHRFRCSSWLASLSWPACCTLVRPCSSAKEKEGTANSPVLEPNLHGPLSHVDILGNSFARSGGRSRVLVKFHFESRQLILSGTLAFVVLLLLSQSAFAMRPATSRSSRSRRGRSCARSRWGRG